MALNPKLGLSDMEALRAGGVYIPPFKMRRLKAKIAANKKSEAYQRLQWEALRKSINGPVNKVNVGNIRHIAVELLQQNIIRGRGLLCRSIMKAQMASPAFTHVYAALVAIINSKIPEIGELLCKRVISQFQRAYRRNDKILMKGIATFVAHLTNHQILHELCALQILHLLLVNPTNDSVEVAKELTLNCGQTLSKLARQALNAIVETMRNILQEVTGIDQRVQYELEALFGALRTKFKEYPAIVEELDLIDEDDIITHNLELQAKHDQERTLDVFHYDVDWDLHETEYGEIRKEILGSESDEETSDDSDAPRGEGSDGAEGDAEGEDSSREDNESDETGAENTFEITDFTNSSVLSLRRSIYLTFVSSLTAEEMAHKVLKRFEGKEKHVAFMILEACANERSYRKQFGLLAARLCKVEAVYEDAFDELFPRQYEDMHMLDTNKIRNVGRFFAYLLVTDALDWSILEFIKLTEHDTNPSKRIFIKVLFQEMASTLGSKLRERLESSTYGNAFDGLFPKENPKNIRFSINFFTTLGLGGLTETMRARLKSYQKQILKQQQEMVSSSDEESSDEDDSDDEPGTGSDSDSDSDSDSESESGSGSGSGSDGSKDKEESKKMEKISHSHTPSRREDRHRTQETAGRRDYYQSRDTRSRSEGKNRDRRRRHVSRSKSRSKSRSRSRRRRRRRHDRHRDRSDRHDDRRDVRRDVRRDKRRDNRRDYRR